MTDLTYEGMTDDELAAVQQDAKFCLLLAQTPALRTRFMAILDATKAEQDRRRAQ